MADVEAEWEWGVGLAVCFSAITIAYIAYFAVTYPRQVLIMSAAIAAVVFVPYAVGWATVRVIPRLTGIEVEGP